MVGLCRHQEPVNKPLRGSRVFKGSKQHRLVKVAGNDVVVHFMMGAAAYHIVAAVVNMVNYTRVFRHALYLHLNFVTHSNGVGAAKPVKLKYALKPGVIYPAIFRFCHIPATRTFIDKRLHYRRRYARQ